MQRCTQGESLLKLEADIWRCFYGPQNTKIASTPPEARVEARHRVFPTALGGANPVDTLILDFQPPEPGENKSQLFKPSVSWCFVIAALAYECSIQL